MLRRLILHLGMGKTGSTTLQTFLKKNRDLLLSEGFAVSCPGEIQPDPHRNLMDTPRFLNAVDVVLDRVRAAGADSLIWSLEGFGTVQFAHDPARLDAILSRLPASDVQVVAYVRRQDSFAASAYLQWNVVHKGYKGPVQTFDERFPSIYGEGPGKPIEATNLNYHEVLRPWVEAFGLKRVAIRPFEQGQFIDGDLITDFITAARLPAANYDRNVRANNVTFNMELTDMLGMYASTFDGPVLPNKMDGFFNSFGNDEYFSAPFFTKFELPPAQRREILAECEPFNARVAREYLGRADGVLFKEPWPEPDAPYTPYAGMTLEKLVPILMYILQKQHARIAGLYERFNALADGKDLSGFARGPQLRGQRPAGTRSSGADPDREDH